MNIFYGRYSCYKSIKSNDTSLKNYKNARNFSTRKCFFYSIHTLEAKDKWDYSLTYTRNSEWFININLLQALSKHYLHSALRTVLRTFYKNYEWINSWKTLENNFRRRLDDQDSKLCLNEESKFRMWLWVPRHFGDGTKKLQSYNSPD